MSDKPNRPQEESSSGSAAFREIETGFLTTLLANTPDFVYFKDRERRYVKVSRPFEELFGLRGAEIRGKRDEELFPPAVAAEGRRDDRRVIEQGIPLVDKVESTDTPGGDKLWVSTTKIPWRDGDGNILGLFGISRDITIRVLAEEALRVERERLGQSEAELQRSQSHLRKLAGRLLTAQEDERRRLAREIHDDLTQRLAVLTIQARELERLVGDSSAGASGLIDEICGALKGLSEEARHLSHQLHPGILEDLGLVDALATECDGFSRRHGVTVTFHAAGVPQRLKHDIAICLYRISQEALHNVAKHANTREAAVSIVGHDEHLELTVSDKGNGFNPTTPHAVAGVGLSSMQERARLVGARFRIESSPGTGTRVSVRVPLG